MPLQSQLFQGDAKLEAAAVSDGDHIVPGAAGPHVGKIQQALIAVDGADIDPDSIYGPATAAAVLDFKRRRDIVNRAYQTQADNIVGKLTMAALDREMRDKEFVPSGPTRFEPISPVPRTSRPAEFPQRAGALLLGFKVGAPFADEFPQLPSSLILSPSRLEIPPGQVGSFRVIHGIGKEIVCQNPSVATIAPLDLPPNAHTLTKVKITQDPQIILVFAKNIGKTSITVKPVSLFNPILTVTVPAVVSVFFHFLDGPAGIKTARTAGDLTAMLARANEIYRRNNAGISFVNGGVNASLKVPSLGGGTGGVRVSRSFSTPDSKAIKAHQQSGHLFNVFFVGSFVNPSLEGTSENFLALTSRPPDDDKPLRCCLFRDHQQSDPPGLDPGQTLAHEAGHALGEDDDKSNAKSLMFFDQSKQADTLIDFAMSDRMIDSFQKFPP